ncbi:MAG: hypothetical protein CL583_06385 [Alteromonadaceae bacterium]|nr:hypothetical protein [Alteromonadaceae bacterium]|tara:strand:+ start:223 stop:843 length:621 start_codon:yes stop_codon:yes gene_type:complete
MRIATLLFALLLALPASAVGLEEDLLELQQRWARIQYETPEDDGEKAFEALADDAAQLVARFPGRAEPLIWEGIILSTYAGAKGGFGALGLVKKARRRLEAALDLDKLALQGSAYTSLGSLYHKVPGWPLGYGDDEKAEAYLRKALNINPAGIDPNFFFAEFLVDQGQPDRARVYLNKALEAPARPGRERADEGRREEARLLLEKL